MDYLAPQLYWPIDRTEQSFPVLLEWWAGENRHGRHLWPGLFTSRTLPGEGWEAEEILRQVYVTRGHPGADGHIHFSMRALSGNMDSVAVLMSREAYRRPALVPESPWLNAERPRRPRLQLTATDSGAALVIIPSNGPPVLRWVVHARAGETWTTRILPAAETRIELGPAEEVRVVPVGRLGREGAAAVAGVPR